MTLPTVSVDSALADVVATQSVEVYYACFGAWAVSYMVDWRGERP